MTTVYVLSIEHVSDDNVLSTGLKPIGVYSTRELAQRAYDEFLYDYDDCDLIWDTRQCDITEYKLDALE